MRPVARGMTRLAAVATAVAVVAVAGCGSDGRSLPARERESTAGDWQPWVLASPDAIHVPAPPGAGSDAASRDDAAAHAAVQARSSEQERKATRVERDPAVRPWLEHAMDFVAARSKNPPTASRNYALLSVAMYDAAVAAWHSKYRYRRPAPEADALVTPPPEPSYPSEHAAVGAAASRVLAHLYPEQPGAALERQAEEMAKTRVQAGVARPSDVSAGLDLGRAVARRVISYAERDGADRRWNGERPRGPAYWAPPPGSAGRPVQPLAGTWRTWILRSGRQLRPPPPPRFGTGAFEREARAVIRAQEELTPRQKRLARFWEGGEGSELPPGIWIRVALERLESERMSTPSEARVLALLTVTMADAGVAAWDAKYKYWYPRPVNGIRDSGIDPDWKPLLSTPLFPAYVSGHATYSAAAGEVMAHIFPGEERLWRRRGREAGLSRIWGGIHWPVDNVFGARMGKQIGRLTVEHAKHDGAEG